LYQLGFIDNFLAGGVHQQTAFRHPAHQSIINGVLGFRRCGDVQRNDVAGRIKLLGRSHSLYTVFLDNLFRAESVECVNIHTETFGYAGYIAAYVTVSMNAQLLAFQLRTGSTVVQIADSHYHKPESQFGHSVGVLPRSVHHTYIVGGCGIQVHIVIPRTGTHYDFQLFGGIQNLGINNVAADNNGIGIFHGFQQFCLIAIFLQQGKFIACCFNFFANTVYCNFCKRLVCCN